MIQQSTIDDYNRRKLVKLIIEVSRLHGGDDDEFLSEYIAQVIKEWSNNLLAAIACFEDLKANAKWTQPAKRVIEPYQGHRAFREHYEQLETDQPLGKRNGERLVKER